MTYLGLSCFTATATAALYCRRALQRMGVPLDQSETLFSIIDANKMGEVPMRSDRIIRTVYILYSLFIRQSYKEIESIYIHI